MDISQDLNGSDGERVEVKGVCVLCSQEFDKQSNENENIGVLRCGHVFHFDCASKRLEQKHKECAVCKMKHTAKMPVKINPHVDCKPLISKRDDSQATEIKSTDDSCRKRKCDSEIDSPTENKSSKNDSGDGPSFEELFSQRSGMEVIHSERNSPSKESGTASTIYLDDDGSTNGEPTLQDTAMDVVAEVEMELTSDPAMADKTTASNSRAFAAPLNSAIFIENGKIDEKAVIRPPQDILQRHFELQSDEDAIELNNMSDGRDKEKENMDCGNDNPEDADDNKESNNFCSLM
ncbi:ring finger domain-containing protein [Ditylenchus destructor]|uniref:Ring finger domain-containing protein n=1 Tax=Ditylenchus destructor TaxID=166010 RepID=A0AAD4N985_9BILA|nr:ring finger domain-containing protein [Ditylenchus destructor]